MSRFPMDFDYHDDGPKLTTMDELCQKYFGRSLHEQMKAMEHIPVARQRALEAIRREFPNFPDETLEQARARIDASRQPMGYVPLLWQDLEPPFQEPRPAFTSSYQFFYQHVVFSRARLLVLRRKAHRRWWRVARIILIRYAWRWL